MSVSLWSDPTDPEFVLARVNTEWEALRTVTEAHLGLVDYTYWDNTDPDPDVANDEWNARCTAWNALRPGEAALVNTFDASGQLFALLHDDAFVELAAAALHAQFRGRLGLPDVAAARAALQAPLDAPMSARRAVVMGHRTRRAA